MNRAGAVVLLSVLALAPPALAEAPAPERARLDYTRAAGADTCPDVSVFRNEVAAKLGGRDPFTSDAGKRVLVLLRRPTRGTYAAAAVLYDGDGRERGSRRFSDASCGSLVETMSVVLASWLSPIEVPAPPEPQPEKPKPGPLFRDPWPETPAKELPTSAPPAPRPALQVELGPLISFTTLPGVAGFGLVGGVGMRWPMFSVHLEMRTDLPASTEPSGPSEERGHVWMFSAALAPCLHVGWFVGCGLASSGAAMLQSQSDRPSVYGALGLRAGAEIPISPRFALRATGDLLVAVRRPVLYMNGDEAWKLPSTGESLGLRLVMSF